MDRHSVILPVSRSLELPAMFESLSEVRYEREHY